MQVRSSIAGSEWDHQRARSTAAPAEGREARPPACKQSRLTPLRTETFPAAISLWRFGTDGFCRWTCNWLIWWWPGTELNRRRQPFQG